MSAKLLQLFSTLCDPMDRKLLCLWDSPSKNTGVGCHAFLQRIFPTQDWTHVSSLPTLAGSLPLVPPGKPTGYIPNIMQKGWRITAATQGEDTGGEKLSAAWERGVAARQETSPICSRQLVHHGLCNTGSSGHPHWSPLPYLKQLVNRHAFMCAKLKLKMFQLYTPYLT